MKKVTVYFKSNSEKGKFYKTERHRDGKVTCFCPSFVYRGTCRHAEAAKHYKITQ